MTNDTADPHFRSCAGTYECGVLFAIERLNEALKAGATDQQAVVVGGASLVLHAKYLEARRSGAGEVC